MVATVKEQHKPSTTDFLLFLSKAAGFVLSPMEAMAITIINLLIFPQKVVTSAGIIPVDLIMQAATKPTTNQGNVLTRLKLLP